MRAAAKDTDIEDDPSNLKKRKPKPNPKYDEETSSGDDFEKNEAVFDEDVITSKPTKVTKPAAPLSAVSLVPPPILPATLAPAGSQNTLDRFLKRSRPQPQVSKSTDESVWQLSFDVLES